MQKNIILKSAAGIVSLLGLYFASKKSTPKDRLTEEDVKKSTGIENLSISMPTYKDLTAQITSNTVVFPGDPIFEKKQVASLGKGCCFNLFEIKLGNHTGTHIDFPAHVIKGGKVSSDYSIDDLVSEGVIIEVPESEEAISESFLKTQNICRDDFVFFKTSNSKLSKQAELTEKFVFIEPSAAKALLEIKVRLVGIDYISVDSYTAESLPVHNILLRNDILIVENLELEGVDPGRCTIHVMPMNIPDMDGLPARVIMSR